MLISTLFTVLAAGLATAAPLDRRDVSLNAAAVAEAQKFDATATRALTATTIKTSDGKCLSVDPFSGDFRENLTPVAVVACDGSKNQTWDVLTSGVHNNVKGQALIVSSLTNACLNFDPRRAAGNQVLLFSCGGRADGGGVVATSQLFTFSGTGGTQALVPQNGNNAVCLAVKNGLVDQTACNGAASASGAELFTIGGQGGNQAATQPATGAGGKGAKTTTTAAAATTTAAADCGASTITVTVTVTSAAAATNVAVVEATTTTAAAATTTAAAAATTAAATTTTAKAATTTTPSATITVSGAGGVLNPSAVAESQVKDLTATRAATGVQIKDSNGQCLSVDATAGDFRENLIPVELKDCDGSEGQKFDFITKGVHNDQANSALIVSSLTQGCLNFDPRRAAGDQVILFACGGRADGAGGVTNSQLFPFVAADLTAPYVLAPESGNNAVCLVNSNGRLGNEACDATKPSATELFTIVA